MKRILLTGSDGQLGWELWRSLQRLGNVIALTRQELDLGDPDKIRSVVRTQRPSLIVNAAAYTAVDRAEDHSEVAHRINAIAPGVLAEEAKRFDVPLIHYSTDYVFDGEKSLPYDERDATCPRNVYGHSKLAGEGAVQASGCRHLIFRTSWLYSGRGSNFVKTMLDIAAQRNTVRVVCDQFGAPTWARAIADSTAAIIENLFVDVSSAGDAHRHVQAVSRFESPKNVRGEDPYGIYHMCAAGRTTWADFAATIFAITGLSCTVLPIATSEYSTLARRPRNSGLSNEKLAAVFGVHMAHWQQSLTLFLNELAAESA